MSRIIGITGTNAAGKDEAVSLMVQKLGFIHFSTSDEVRHEASRRGLSHDRQVLSPLANELRTVHGRVVLAERAFARAAGQDCIISGIRNIGEVEFLKAVGDFVLLAVDAPVEMRYARLKGRGRVGDDTTLEAFREIDARERAGDENSQQVGKCMEIADELIINDGTLKELEEKLDNLIRKIMTTTPKT